MSLWAWILLGAVAWLVVGAGVALLVGRMISYRDRQVPDDVRCGSADSVPSPRDGSEEPSARSYDGPATTRRSPGSPPA